MEHILITHSVLRWLILVTTTLLIIISVKNYSQNKDYSKFDNILRSSSLGFLHLQFLIGFFIYFIFSPYANSFLNFQFDNYELAFFGIYHFVLGIAIVVIATIGNVKIKKEIESKQKYRNTIIYFGIALILIILMIPWHRPLFRMMGH